VPTRLPKKLAPQVTQSRHNQLPPRPHDFENGDHITFHCPRYRNARAHLGGASKWADLDRPIWIEEEDEDGWDAVEEFFSYLHSQLSSH